ncbi:MAG TPA: DUF883 C-terminal domain-containing protein [Anaeromyxobacteraceae bacterium]|nr:DUF883 C-terminal domain-containing protein [Anaeromyxobacteraceae bacterium]
MAINGNRGEDLGMSDEGMSGRLGAQVENLRDYASSADSIIREFARERPMAAVGIAIGIGFVLGRLAART